MIYSPQTTFCFTNLSRLVLEIFRFFERHAENLNTPQNNSGSWDLQMGFKLGLLRVKLLGVGADNRKSGMSHCNIAMSSANLMKVTL